MTSLLEATPHLPAGEDNVRRQHALEVLESYLTSRKESGDALVGREISIAFGGVQALKDVSITVPARQFVGLLGPNGAGKSTLFDILNGLKRPDSGSVTMFGQDVTHVRPWHRASLGMGRTFQSNRINPSLTVAENLLSAAHRMISGSLISTLLGLPLSRAAEARAEEVAYAMTVLLDIDEFWDSRAGDLDFGRCRRVEIGRTLMSAPRLVMLDEPAAGLDADEAATLFALLRRLQADLGLTVLLVEHYVKAVLENADLVYVLNRGTLIAAGEPLEVAADPVVRSEYLGSILDLTGGLGQTRAQERGEAAAPAARQAPNRRPPARAASTRRPKSAARPTTGDDSDA